MIPALHGSDPYARYAFTFYWLTALHAAHVVGGFVPLGIVIARARRRQYSSSRYEGVRLCKQYWDYLGVVWIVLLGDAVLRDVVAFASEFGELRTRAKRASFL